VKAFASDNYASAHPDVLAAMAQANDGHAVSYGADPWTARALEVLRGHFGEQSQSLLVFNGSGANVVSIRAVCRPWEAVICADTAHVNVDEGGAPERIAGVKLLTIATPDGKLTPDDVRARVTRVGDEHAVQPRLVTLTQSSEYGTRYAAQEMRALADTAHELGLVLHVDGSRLSNAAAGLDCGLGDLAGEVFLNPALADGAKYLRKQTLQLASKGRFLAAQFVAMFEGDLWRRNAAHANAMAARLAAGLAGIPGVQITQLVQANGVFAVMPRDAADAVRARWPFYTWDETKREERLMCSWDTTAEEVDAFADALAEACGATARS
jgi:threonine aldolase